MLEFIAPIIDTLLDVLKARTPTLLAAEGLEPFQDYGLQFTGVAVNFPSVWVMPVRTEFDPEMAGACHQAHQVQVKFAVSGSAPADVTRAAMLYMRAIDRAIRDSEAAGDFSGSLQAGQVQQVFVRSHDYGPLFERGTAIARFPELDLVIEVVERQ